MAETFADELDWLIENGNHGPRSHAAIKKAARIVRAAEAVNTKWPAVRKATESVFVMGHIHGAKYSGPTIGAEMNELEAALREAQSCAASEGKGE